MDRPDGAAARPSRIAVIAAGVAVVVAGALFAVASRSDEPESPAPGPTAIETGASTDLSILDPPAPSPSTSAEPFSRALIEAGTFDCLNTGLWQPYEELQLLIQVGEPEVGAVCPDYVIPLPPGHCSATPCAEVPSDWEVRLEPGVPPVELLLVVAPDGPNTGRFYCFRNLVNDRAQFYELDVAIEQACPEPTADSIDIPYVPPATSDIPFVPPTESVDIPGG